MRQCDGNGREMASGGKDIGGVGGNEEVKGEERDGKEKSVVYSRSRGQ